MKFPIDIEMDGKLYRVLSLTEIGGMSMTGDGKPEIDYLCRAQWFSPYVGWKKLRNPSTAGNVNNAKEGMVKMSKKELLEINQLARRCGYFYNVNLKYPHLPNINNGYNCDHPKQAETEDIDGQKIGKCYSWSCPLAYSADKETREEFGDAGDCDCETCDGNCEVVVVEYDDEGNIIPQY